MHKYDPEDYIYPDVEMKTVGYAIIKLPILGGLGNVLTPEGSEEFIDTAFGDGELLELNVPEDEFRWSIAFGAEGHQNNDEVFPIIGSQWEKYWLNPKTNRPFWDNEHN